MSAITIFAEPAELFFQPGSSRSRLAVREAGSIQRTSTDHPERRLWKLTTQAVSPRVAEIESFMLLLLLVIALVVITSSVLELSHLLQTEAILHIVTKALPAVG